MNIFIKENTFSRECPCTLREIFALSVLFGQTNQFVKGKLGVY